MEILEIVNKLVGNIHPVGETNADEKRYKNLKDMCDLVSSLVYEIRVVANEKSRGEYSMKKAGLYADNFIKELTGISDPALSHVSQLLKDEYFSLEQWSDKMNHIERIKSWGLFPELVEELDREYSAECIEQRVRDGNEEPHQYDGPSFGC